MRYCICTVIYHALRIYISISTARQCKKYFSGPFRIYSGSGIFALRRGFLRNGIFLLTEIHCLIQKHQLIFPHHQIIQRVGYQTMENDILLRVGYYGFHIFPGKNRISLCDSSSQKESYLSLSNVENPTNYFNVFAVWEEGRILVREIYVFNSLKISSWVEPPSPEQFAANCIPFQTERNLLSCLEFLKGKAYHRAIVHTYVRTCLL